MGCRQGLARHGASWVCLFGHAIGECQPLIAYPGLPNAISLFKVFQAVNFNPIQYQTVRHWSRRNGGLVTLGVQDPGIFIGFCPSAK
jgi:hypothetical protein